MSEAEETPLEQVENPEIAISVLVEHAGGGGGMFAAPIAQKVLERYFRRQEIEPGTPYGPALPPGHPVMRAPRNNTAASLNFIIRLL